MIALLVAAAIAAPYQLVSEGGEWWFRSPAGERFQSHGVCCVNRGLKPEEWNDLNPGYAAHRLFADDAAWAQDTARRLKSMGFDTIGAWSDHALLGAEGLRQTPVLHLSAAGIPWVDPWSPEAAAKAREVARSQIAGWRNLPGVIGYFSDNELGWWSGALWEWTWKGSPGTPGRRRASEMLAARYGTWERLTTDFDPAGAASFAELKDHGRLYLRPGGDGMTAVRAWMEQVADRYYALCAEIVRTEHPGALYLGDRYISNYYPEVVRAAGRHVDVVSTNLDADWPAGEFAPFYLRGLRELAHKPILVTEFYAAAMENRSGNMNDSSGFPTLATQREREASFRRQAEWLLRQPDVVGVHWFQFYDEPRHGRADGENFNMGLVDIHGRTYRGLARAARRSLAVPRRRYADPAPEGKTIPWLPIRTARDLATWPHARAAMPRTVGEPRGDLYLGWNGSGLYGSVYWMEDRFFEAFYRDRRVDPRDHARFRLNLDGKTVVEAILTPAGAEISGANLLRYESGTRNTLTFRVAAPAFGLAAMAEDRPIPFEAELTTRARGYRLAWSGTPRTIGSPRP